MLIEYVLTFAYKHNIKLKIKIKIKIKKIGTTIINNRIKKHKDHLNSQFHKNIKLIIRYILTFA